METVLKRVLTAITVMAVALLPAGRAYAEPASSDAQAEAGVEPVSATQPAPIDPGAATEGMTFEEARQAADCVTVHKGGRGCLREGIEMILKAQGKWHFDEDKFDQIY